MAVLILFMSLLALDVLSAEIYLIDLCRGLLWSFMGFAPPAGRGQAFLLTGRKTSEWERRANGWQDALTSGARKISLWVGLYVPAGLSAVGHRG